MRTEMVTGQRTTVGLRRAGPEDEPFLHALFADRRAPELAVLGWEPAERQAFIAMQFRAQQVGYATAFPAADHWLVSVPEEPVGRLLVDRGPEEHRVVDVVLLARHRGRGIGTALMEEVLGDASAEGVPVRLSVAAHDPRVVRWYERLGFAVVGEKGPNLAMVRPPGNDPAR